MTHLITNAIEAIAREARTAAKRSRGKRGIALPLLAIVMTVLVAMAAVGVDTGRVATVATEAQNAADIAALAGVRAIADEEDPMSKATAVLAQNKINGVSAAPLLQSLTVGNLDENYNWTANGTPANAVKATVVTTVQTVVLGAIGSPDATVTREAIATMGGMGSGVPTLPVVIGDCHFNPSCTSQSCMPYLSQVPNTTNNSAWTSFFTANASNSTVGQYMPSPCEAGLTQFLKVGDIINLNNGQTNPLLSDVQCLLDHGMDTFVIPIVPCIGGNYNQSKTVVGFAKIRIDSVKSTGSPKGIWLHGIWDGSPGSPGGGNFGLNVISLAK